MVKPYFSKEEEKEIINTIRHAERATSGEVRVHLKRKCKKDAMTEALEVFRKLKMEKTREGNAVLIFIAPESRQFAIVGGRAIHEKVGGDFWQSTRDLMTAHFKEGRVKEGVLEGIRRAGEKLKQHFPASLDNPNELSDNPTED